MTCRCLPRTDVGSVPMYVGCIRSNYLWDAAWTLIFEAKVHIYALKVGILAGVKRWALQRARWVTPNPWWHCFGICSLDSECFIKLVNSVPEITKENRTQKKKKNILSSNLPFLKHSYFKGEFWVFSNIFVS